MESLLRASKEGRMDADVVLVVSNKPDARGLDVARAAGAPAVCVPSKGVEKAEHERRVVAAIEDARPDLVCLAGYMRILSPEFVKRFEGRVLNVHPSLLPAFVGLDAQAQAHQHGTRIAGCTTHFVTADLDAGPIVMQAAVPVPPGASVDEVRARILEAEHVIYPATVHALATGRARLEGGRVVWRDVPAQPRAMLMSPAL